MKEKHTKKATRGQRGTEMLPEYDFSKGVRGKYAKRFANGTNLVRLDPDVAKHFSSDRAVNQALRSVIQQVSK